MMDSNKAIILINKLIDEKILDSLAQAESYRIKDYEQAIHYQQAKEYGELKTWLSGIQFLEQDI